ncbi:unnamed protein product [Debaryomyces tyrocola]|nr:unnamed protein product [Debaryomyces tyrocola]
MKLNSYLTLASYAALFSMSQAAPALITRTHTAPAVTHWVTYTSNTVVKVVTAQDTVNNAPPASPTPEAEPQGEQQDGQQDDQQNEATTSTQADNQAQNTVPATSPQTTQETTPTTQQTTQQTTQDNTPTTEQTTTSSTEEPSTPTTLSTSTSGTSTSSTSTSDSTASSGFEADILNAHNEKRALHGVQSLAWNDTLAKYAADYAASTFSCDNVKLVHSNGPYGENLAAGYSGGSKPVKAWYDEIKQYDFSNPGFNEATGHFTQLVWKSTSQVGCARVTCDNSWSQYTICEYSNTRGNVVGTDSKTGKNYFSENVLKPIN